MKATCSPSSLKLLSGRQSLICSVDLALLAFAPTLVVSANESAMPGKPNPTPSGEDLAMLPQFKRVADGELTMFNQHPSAHKDKEANWRRAEGAVLNGHAPVLADGRSAPRQMDRKALDGAEYPA